MNPINNIPFTHKIVHDTEFEENGTAKRLATEALQAVSNAQQELRPLSAISASVSMAAKVDPLTRLAALIRILVLRKDFEKVKKLIHAYPCIHEWKNKIGETVLSWLIVSEQWDSVQELLKLPSCDVNSTLVAGPNVGATPLWYAVILKQWDVVREMLKHPGCNLNATLTNGVEVGKTALWLAVDFCQWDVVKEMLKHPNCNVNAAPTGGPKAGQTVLWLAARLQQWDLVREMLKRPGCDVNANPASGEAAGATVLWHAAYYQQWDVVKEMLKHPGCDVNANPASGVVAGITVLWLAASYQQWDVVKEIIKRPSCNVIVAPTSGLTAGLTVLWLAARFQQWDVVKEILKHPCGNVNVFPLETEYAKKTVLWFLKEHCASHPKIYAHLLLMNATINEITPDDKAFITRIDGDKRLLEQSFRKASILLDEYDDRTTSPFAMLPLEVIWSIIYETLYALHPELRKVPVGLINEKIKATCTQIASEKKEKAIEAFCTSAYRLWRVEILGISEPNHLKFNDLRRLFRECLAKTGPVKLNRDTRNQLLNRFKHLERPLTESKILKLIETVLAPSV